MMGCSAIRLDVLGSMVVFGGGVAVIVLPRFHELCQVVVVCRTATAACGAARAVAEPVTGTRAASWSVVSGPSAVTACCSARASGRVAAAR